MERSAEIQIIYNDLMALFLEVYQDVPGLFANEGVLRF